MNNNDKIQNELWEAFKESSADAWASIKANAKAMFIKLKKVTKLLWFIATSNENGAYTVLNSIFNKEV